MPGWCSARQKALRSALSLYAIYVQRASLGLDKDRGYYLDKYSVDTILIGCDSSLEWFLRGDSRWQESYRDAKAVIFTRKGN